MRQVFAIGILLGIVVLACAPQQPAATAPVPFPMLVDDCAPACAVLAQFSCPAAATSKTGVTCASICQAAVLSGYLSWPSTCVKNATNRQAIILCGIGC